ncbi:S24 family peptidase [Pseudomonas sp. HR96]|uniref:S24 family peptidase n=1 Tax=Pseudomonas sp. HR96 TaxID=1027966 RepID=UPI002A74E27C|nr:S24 family peptidase [Pseudomonas sp. HR96]WPO99463.1 S24 family peptidase [Pseudomonas sp. HR96]
MNTSGDRLKHLLFECDLRPADFAAHRNLTPQHIYNWFTRGVPAARLDEIATLLSVRAYWLRTGKGPKYPNAPDPSAPFEPASLAFVRRQGISQNEALVKAISRADDCLVSFHALSGEHLLPLQDAQLRLPRQAFESVGVRPDDSIALLMPDTSMIDRLPARAPLVIDSSLTHIVDGQPYALIHEGALHVRYLYRQPNGGLRMRCHNFIEYPDRILSARESGPQDIRVLGWMFWHASLSAQRPRSG